MQEASGRFEQGTQPFLMQATYFAVVVISNFCLNLLFHLFGGAVGAGVPRAPVSGIRQCTCTAWPGSPSSSWRSLPNITFSG